MQTTQLNLSNSTWETVLSDGGNALLSGATGAVRIHYNESDTAPPIDSVAHSVDAADLKKFTGFINIPTGTRMRIRSEKGIQTVVVTR